MNQLLKIYKDDAPELRVICQSVSDFNDELRQTAMNMWATMLQARGCGLAANQVGLDIRLICVKCKDFSNVMINPTWIVPDNNDTKEASEGCLSVSNKNVKKSRFNTITVNYLDLDGKSHIIELSGTAARIVQHECDHLEGRLITDEV